MPKPKNPPGQVTVYMYVAIILYGPEHQPEAQVFLQPEGAVRFAIRQHYQGRAREYDTPLVIQGAVERLSLDGEYGLAKGDGTSAYVYQRAVQ